MNAFIRTITLLLLVAILGWWTLLLRGKLNEHEMQIAERDREIKLISGRLEEKEGQIVELDQKVQEQAVQIQQAEETIERLDLSLSLLKVDHRVARIQVIEQETLEGELADNGQTRVRTRIRFVELGPDGQPIGDPREATIEGSRLFVESLVIKFEDSYVEQGDMLRGSSLVLFKRLFGDQQEPSSGIELDAVGSQPRIYGDEDGGAPLHAELWQRFWDYANDPEAAAKKGVRAMHGEAPFMELRPGGSYRVELRASGGLDIHAE